jgi:hypothetical protein
MKQRLVIALLAILCFGAGFMARRLTEDGPTVPPPPAALGTEFARTAPATAPADAKGGPHRANGGGRGDQAPNRTKLVADVERYRSQIETYRKSLDELDAEFDRSLNEILTPEQRDLYAARQKRYAERRARGEAREAASPAPLTDDQIFRLQQGPLANVLYSVAISMRFDGLNHDLKLDEAQQTKVRALLLTRREKFIALVDSIPPPSIMLSRLAPVAQKLAAEPKK